MRLFGAGFKVEGLFDELRNGRCLENEGEGPVFIDGDEGGDDLAAQVLGLGVVLVDELHDVDAMLTKSGANGRSGVSRAGGKV